jgi:hypothetical protein
VTRRAALTRHAMARAERMDIPLGRVLALLTGETPGQDYPSITRAGARVVADGCIAVPYRVESDGIVTGLTVLWDGATAREQGPNTPPRRSNP